jgi:hypothetical protein
MIANQEKGFARSKPLVYLFAALEGEECLQLIDDFYRFALTNIDEQTWDEAGDLSRALGLSEAHTAANPYWQGAAYGLTKTFMRILFRESSYIKTLTLLYTWISQGHRSQNYTQDKFFREFRTRWRLLYGL